MSEEDKVETKVDGIIKYNEQLINTVTMELKSYQEDSLNDVSLLIFEKQISLLKFLKKLNSDYLKVNKVLEKDAKSGKKTTLKKMKKVVKVEDKKKKKKKKSSSSSSDKSDSDKPQKKAQTGSAKKAATDKKKAVSEKKK